MATGLVDGLEQHCSRQLLDELEPYIQLLKHHYHSLVELQRTTAASLHTLGLRAGLVDQLLAALPDMDELPRLAWWDKELTAEGMRCEVQQLEHKHAQSLLLPKYSKHAAVLAVYTSNQQESTLPAGVSEQQAFTILGDAWELAELPTRRGTFCRSLHPTGQCHIETASSSRGIVSYVKHGVNDEGIDHCCMPSCLRSSTQNEDQAYLTPAQAWRAEGGSNREEGKAQLLQHMRALRFVSGLAQQQLPLTSERLVQAHSILMAGAIDEGGAPSAHGLRTQGAYALTGHVYMDAGDVADAVAQCLLRFEEDHAGGADTVELAASLFYNLVHRTHPFVNGNGRLGHLLITYVLMRRGLPFPLALVNGDRRARKQFEAMVQKYAQLRRPTHLSSYILECLRFRWRDFDLWASNPMTN